VVNSLKHEKPVKECLIFKREAPGICLVHPMVNPTPGTVLPAVSLPVFN